MLIVANWKMNLSLKEAENLIMEFISLSTPKNEIVIAPQFTQIHHLSQILANSKIELSGQNCCHEKSGAFTGEISPEQLKELGCKYVILGHSERRNIFNEESSLVHKKAQSVIECDMIPIICVGESLKQRENGETNEVLSKQINKSVPEGLSADKYVIAYEPIWAIGTGKVASIDDISAAHTHIESIIGEDVKLLYGGSVNNKNCEEIAAIENVNGLLVGGASLSSDSFAPIMHV